MSKIFYDRLIVLDDVDREIKSVVQTKEEQEELWHLVDEIVHHRALGFILDKLPKKDHSEFLGLFHRSPHNEDLLFGYLKEKIGENVEEILKQELGEMAFELLEEIKTTKK